MYLAGGRRSLLPVAGGLLLGYWALMTFVPVPGYGVGRLDVEGNLAAYLDLLSPEQRRLSDAYFEGDSITRRWGASDEQYKDFLANKSHKFNTAYAAHFGLEAEVTQLHSLAEAEQFIKAGIPLVASIAFQPNKLDGFLFRGTDGHLLVIGGFTAGGDVISYDPASTSDATVRHVYDRAQFEKAPELGQPAQ